MDGISGKKEKKQPLASRTERSLVYSSCVKLCQDFDSHVFSTRKIVIFILGLLRDTQTPVRPHVYISFHTILYDVIYNECIYILYAAELSMQIITLKSWPLSNKQDCLKLPRVKPIRSDCNSR